MQVVVNKEFEMGVSSVGIGSGLDVESIVTQLVALEKAPLTTLQTKAETIQTKISSYGQIKSLVDELNSAVRDLTLDSGFSAVKINSSSTSVANATMTGQAATGSYNLNVVQLAQSQTSATTKLASASATMGTSGTLRFVVGNPANTATTLKTVDLAISSSDTLEGIVGKINSDSELSKTVIASVITDSTGQQQLMVRARETGKDNQFSMSFGEAGATTVVQADLDAWDALVDKGGVARPVLGSFVATTLADPSSATNFQKLASTTGVTQTQAAQNAELKLNGVELESNTNAFASVVPGLTINVSAVGTSLLSITQDTDATKDKIQKFVDAYNAVNDLLSSSTKYDADSGVKGVLQGDSSTVSLQNSLRMLTQGIVGNATGKFTRLSDIGIQMQQGGALKVDSTKLAEALGDMASVKSLFATKADALGNGGGIAVNFKSVTDGLLAWEGALNNKTDSLEAELNRNSDAQTKINTRASTVEARLRSQYSALDTKMASLTSLSSYVEQMVASWNKSSD